MRDSGLSGRLAVVTGAGGGIGAAVVRLLVEEGARVVATDLPSTALSGLAFLNGVRVEPLDVSDGAAVEALFDRIEAEDGPIDLVASVAGVLSNVTVDQTSDAEWRRVFAVNADGVFHLGRAASRRMGERGKGAFVTVSSNAAGVPRHAMAAYAASKAAATMFTRCLGLELGPKGVRCNIVAPGSTLTSMQTGMWADEDGAARVIAGSSETFKAGIPLQKLATPEDIAEAVVFLLSDRAAHITMTDLYVDGGATLRA
ncbi:MULTISPECIES: 2,3-dihydro-2,3-dihydroxybenzoate dehydrogenase [Brevundimonas]|uniref:2,3-dihydro-2,3-dihydroxybenzoate dehydrogenase n=1 Tax=Brevundimonas TaxID=41275 RepID=UPI0006274ACC|nr:MULTISPECIES: 2,3-dihydro-2,3-dihydroxybenzoate dehydrogenase [Brevundimonas]OMG59633.1 2,3-dihydro-2,3-dihydroxybenzoate dehydrogenase [Brevundimonas sp. ZS04]